MKKLLLLLLASISALSQERAVRFDPLTTSITQPSSFKELDVSTNNGVNVIRLHNFSPPTGQGHNIFLGENSGNYTLTLGGGSADLAGYNVAVGDLTMTSATTAQNNVVVGHNALHSVTTGSRFVAIGYDALKSQDVGAFSVGIGDAALAAEHTNGANIGIGYVAGRRLTTGQLNTIIGHFAGEGLDPLNAPVTDNWAILIGDHANRSVPSATHLTNYIGIGKRVEIDKSNQIKLGTSEYTETNLYGNVGINTVNPSEKLEVTGIDAVAIKVHGSSTTGGTRNAKLVLWQANDGASDPGGRIDFNSFTTEATVARIDGLTNTTANGGQLLFSTANTSGSVTERFRIDSNGSLSLASNFLSAFNGVASTSAESLTGTWFTGGTSTTTKPHLLIEPTGTTSNAWGLNGTAFGINAASGSTANLIDAQVNAVSLFKVFPQSGGGIIALSGSSASSPRNVITISGEANGRLEFGLDSSDNARIALGEGGGSARDTFVYRLAAANLRLGAAPSATPIANTITIGESSRGTIDTNIAGANGTITSGTGTGNATGSSLIFQTPTATGSGTGAQALATRLTLNSSGAAIVGSVDVGSSNVVLDANGARVSAGLYLGWLSRSHMASSADGFITMSNGALNGFSGLILGTNDASGVRIKKNGTAFNFRLGDDSADAAITAAGGTFSAPVKLPGYTVATLPAGTVGMTAYVTDATAPTYLGALVGGGAVTCPVFYNGSAWVSH